LEFVCYFILLQCANFRTTIERFILRICVFFLRLLTPKPQMAASAFIKCFIKLHLVALINATCLEFVCYFIFLQWANFRTAIERFMLKICVFDLFFRLLPSKPQMAVSTSIKCFIKLHLVAFINAIYFEFVCYFIFLQCANFRTTIERFILGICVFVFFFHLLTSKPQMAASASIKCFMFRVCVIYYPQKAKATVSSGETEK